MNDDWILPIDKSRAKMFSEQIYVDLITKNMFLDFSFFPPVLMKKHDFIS